MYINGVYRQAVPQISSQPFRALTLKSPRIVIAMEGGIQIKGFQINDNGKPKVDEKTFHYNVSNKMKKDMDDAYLRLLGKDDYFQFTFGANQGTIVKGEKRNSLPGYNTALCLRIDMQDTFIENIAGKNMQIANIQIQLNEKIRPSTIAQVHFQCGVDIPGDVIRCAFETSWTKKKNIYVYKN